MSDSTATGPTPDASPTPVSGASPSPAPGASASKGGTGLAALIVGIAAMVFAVIPGLCFVAFIPAIIAVVLGIVALVKKHPKRGRALSGVILGAVALIVAIIVSITTIVVGVSGSTSHDASATVPLQQKSAAPATSTPPKEAAKPTKAAEAPVPADVAYTGTGDSVVKIAIPDGMDEPAVATITHAGSSNFAVWGLDDAMAQKGLLVNTIGNYKGTVLFNMGLSKGVTSLQVTADGAWTVTLHSLKTLREFTGNTVAGTGDDVVVYRGKAGAAAITHDGQSNFAVWSYGNSTDLVVNEIGAYSGTVRWAAGPAVIAVSADGNWNIAVN